MELWEVFDASSDSLLACLTSLREQLPIVRGPDRFKLIQLQDCISTELQERGQSDALFSQLALTQQQGEVGPPAAPPTILQQELTAIIQEARSIAGTAQQSESKSEPAASKFEKEPKTPPKQDEIPSAYQNYDLDPTSSRTAEEDSSDDEDDDDDIVDDTPVKEGGIRMTPLEAALAAFRAERRQVVRARASIVHKKKPTGSAAVAHPPPAAIRRKAPRPSLEATESRQQAEKVGPKQAHPKLAPPIPRATPPQPQIAPASYKEPQMKAALPVSPQSEHSKEVLQGTIAEENDDRPRKEEDAEEKNQGSHQNKISPPPLSAPLMEMETRSENATVGSFPPPRPSSPHTSDGGHSSSLDSQDASDNEDELQRSSANRPQSPFIVTSSSSSLPAPDHSISAPTRTPSHPPRPPSLPPSQADDKNSSDDSEYVSTSSDDEEAQSKQKSKDRSEEAPGGFLRAVVDGFGAIDRWSDWDHGDKMGVTAWSKEEEEDEILGLIKMQQHREARHAPPQHHPPPAPLSDKKTTDTQGEREREGERPQSSREPSPLSSGRLRPSSAQRPQKSTQTRSGQSTADRPKPPRPPPSSQTLPPPLPNFPGNHYLSSFNSFHEILSIMHHLLVSYHMSNAASSSPSPPPSSLFHPSDIIDKYKGLMIRCRAWLDEMDAQREALTAAALAKANRYKGILIPCSNNESSYQSSSTLSPNPPPKPPLDPNLRYYAVADDSSHPEVREVLKLAMEGWEGWEPDPIDQNTAGPSPPRPANFRHPSPTASSSANVASSASRPVTALNQPRPLAGRCHLWNVLWTWSVKVRVPFSDLLVWQKVNHFPEARQLTRKDLLKKHLSRCQAMYSASKMSSLFNIMPTTFTLPKEAAQFQEAYGKASHGVEASITQPKGLNLWILKPVALSRGRGIRIISDWVQEVGQAAQGTMPTFEEPAVVQRYLTSPLLIQGYKFDLRLYVAVTSFNPLEAWLCTEGFARFSTVPFTLDSSKLDDTLVHLTNSSIQKQRSDQGQLPSFLKQAETHGGSKCSLSTLSDLLASQGIEWTSLWSQIQQVVLVALFAAQDSIPHCVNSFELFGFDIIIDSSLKAWIIEVNSSPSLSLDTPLDKMTKPAVVKGLLQLLDPLPFDREALLAALDHRIQGGKSRIARGRNGVGLMTGTAMEERELMCGDLQQVLRGNVPRAYGSELRVKGEVAGAASYQRLAPSPLYDKLLKLKK